ncbi:MAG: hypothetical protein ACRDKY_11785, partial [Solirubrobacteraceae bacterium]
RYANASGSSTTDLTIAALDMSRRRFAAVLPAGEPSPLLLVSIAYRDVQGAGGRRESGDAHFSIGLKQYRRRRPTAVTAHARVRCAAAATRAQRCRLRQVGTVRRPTGSHADCRGGRVLVTVLAGGRRVLQTTVPTTTTCRYRLRRRVFSLGAGIDSVWVKTRFLGSPSLTSRRAPTVRIRLGT